MSEEREAFEAWAKEEFELRADGLKRMPNGDYKYSAISDTWAAWQAARQSAGATGQEPICATCNGNGMIGGPSYYAPDEGGEPCPACAAPIVDNGAKPKIVRLHASGGTTGYSDFMMSDGSVRTLKVADIQPEDWRDDAQPAESKRVELSDDEEILDLWKRAGDADECADAILALKTKEGE